MGANVGVRVDSVVPDEGEVEAEEVDGGGGREGGRTWVEADRVEVEGRRDEDGGGG